MNIFVLSFFTTFEVDYNDKMNWWTEILFGNKEPFYSTVKNWSIEFNCGRRLLKDKVREGRPKIAVVSESTDTVSELIM